MRRSINWHFLGVMILVPLFSLTLYYGAYRLISWVATQVLFHNWLASYCHE